MADFQEKNSSVRPASNGDETRSALVERPPIVAVMGHVDHGKTTLLDYIRINCAKAAPFGSEPRPVAGREAGGITQSIGAYEIVHTSISINQSNQHKSASKKITFIDTPGHEAFSKMRERGAQVADLAILVVAADDGVKPQTKDALEHIKKAEIPFIVAINKIDKNNADIEKAKNDLKEAGVLLEGEGGNVPWQAISAKKGEGVNELLDLILLVAEMEDLKYDPAAQPRGLILTARLDQRRGMMVGGVIRNGRLARNQFIATASAKGKIKILGNFLGEAVEILEPSAPVLIIGFENLPACGEEFVASENLAQLAQNLSPVGKAESISPKTAVESSVAAFNLILRADEAGSLEALTGLVEKIAGTFPLTVVDAAVGNINESDVKLADSVKAMIVGFKTKTDKPAESISKNQQVPIINSEIIYDLEKALKEFFEAGTAAVKSELEVLAVFGKRKGREQIVGGRILTGIVKNRTSFEIWRDVQKIGSGRVLNLQSQKQDTVEAAAGQEIGLLTETDIPIEVGYKLIFN